MSENNEKKKKVRIQNIVHPTDDNFLPCRVLRSILHDVIEKVHDRETVEYAKKCFDRMDELDAEITKLQDEQYACNRAVTRLMMFKLA